MPFFIGFIEKYCKYFFLLSKLFSATLQGKKEGVRMKNYTIIVGMCALLAHSVYADHMETNEDGEEIRHYRSGKSTEPFVHVKAEDSEHIITNHRAQSSSPKEDCQERADKAFNREEKHEKLKRMHKKDLHQKKDILDHMSRRPNRTPLNQRKEEILPRRNALTTNNATRETILEQAAQDQYASNVYTPEAIALKKEIKEHKKAINKHAKEARSAASDKNRAYKEGKLEEYPEVEKEESLKPFVHKEKKETTRKKASDYKKKQKNSRSHKNDHDKYARPTEIVREQTIAEKKAAKKEKRANKKERRLERAEQNEASKKRLRNLKASNDFQKLPEHDVEEKQIKRKRLFSEDIDVMQPLVKHHKENN